MKITILNGNPDNQKLMQTDIPVQEVSDEINRI